MDKNSLLYWFPIVSDIPGLNIPQTEILPLTESEKKSYEGEGDDLLFDISRFITWIHGIAIKRGLPLFLRTDHLSAKHSWENTCFLASATEYNIRRNLRELLLTSRTAGLCGLPLNAIIVRQYIPMKTGFKAFAGKMPVNPERRYFIKDGEVQCHHPYWIPEAIQRDLEGARYWDIEREIPDNWEALAAEMNTETEEEVRLLTGYAKSIAERLGGSWSVDFCKGQDDVWYMIDMALAEDSWHSDDCPFCPPFMRKIAAQERQRAATRKEESGTATEQLAGLIKLKEETGHEL